MLAVCTLHNPLINARTCVNVFIIIGVLGRQLGRQLDDVDRHPGGREQLVGAAANLPELPRK